MVPLVEFPKRSCSVSKDRHLHLQRRRAHGVLPGTGEAVPGGGCEAAGEDETGVCAGGDAAGWAGLVCGEAPGAGEPGALLAGAAAAWGSGVAIGPAGAGFRCVNFRDSINRGSRMGKSEVLGTTCK